MSTENLTIGKRDYEVQIEELNQADLRFYSENPRIYSVLNIMGEEPAQDLIEGHMSDLEHVKQLKRSIESNGGLIDPLIVRNGDFTVLEGNSRLAAYRILCKNDPIKWGKVKCKILPPNIDDAAVFALLGQYHIIGKKDWDPFEQAHYLFRRHKQTKFPISSMAQELGITTQRASRMIDVIEFMIKHDDLNKKHWSYYEEYLKSLTIKKHRQNNQEMDDSISKMIRADDIRQAADIRNLTKILKVGDKQSKKIAQKIFSRKISIDEGYKEIQDSGKLDDVFKRLQNFRKVINENSFGEQIAANKESWDRANFEMNKIIKRLEQIKKNYDKQTK
jgi:hypothetical protein